ncbi:MULTISPECIES: hypothetical protein [unclassified Bradyrhizobium]|uniref:hypothetical protein n=1 Tax=unclassified Bradyrhizobium TaxID=2631580 RepID=UPI0023B188C4|nr:hypothetical protein [Bradyrhizobium sp. CSS354]MDE5464951.1 hypothetical protein [Bradyrhizobium sp. CSS354]
MKAISFVAKHPRTAALRALNYTPEIEKIRAARKGRSVPLRDLLLRMGPAYGTVFTRKDCAPERGIELLSQSDMFASEPRGRIIRRDSMGNPDAHEIARFDVLVAGAGTLGENELYGRSIIADRRLAGKYVGPDAMSLVFEEPGSDISLFAYAFLASPTGVRAIRSTSYGTKILRFRDDLFGTLPIPLVSNEATSRVASLVRATIKDRELYDEKLRSARAVVDQLQDIQAAKEMVTDRRISAVIWDGALDTISAWNFASTRGAFSHLSSAWKFRLRDAIKDGGAFNGPRFSRIECDRPYGIDFMSQRDVFLMRPVPRRIARPAIPDRQLLVPSNAILAGSHGQLSEGSLFGKVELASHLGDKCGVTQDILRLLPREGHRAVAYTFLSTAVGQALLKSTAVGTSIPSVRLDLLLKLPYPTLSSTDARLVDSLTSDAELARMRATASETEAIRIIEEEVLPEWLV